MKSMTPHGITGLERVDWNIKTAVEMMSSEK
jgi:hypothetical protein